MASICKAATAAVLGILLFVPATQPAFGEPPRWVNALILLPATTIEAMDRAVLLIRDHGGQVPVTIAPQILFAQLPALDSSAWMNPAGIRAVFSSEVDAEAIRGQYGAEAGLAARIWNRLVSSSRAPALHSPPPEPEKSDVFLPPDFPLRAPSAPRAPPTSSQTSEFLSGSVQVDVFLAESNGRLDANSENWTSLMQDSVASEVTAGVLWWAAAATQGGRPVANLSFNLTFHTPTSEPTVVSTGYEPIARSAPSCNAALSWIGEIMTHLGYPATCTGVRAYAQARREATGRNWAFAIFVANSLSDPDGKFADGLFAYAYQGGPFLVETYDNNGWGIAGMEIVTAHEVGRTFGALDEYASSGCSDSTLGGYLGVANTNCENGNPATETSIMRGTASQDLAYGSHLISAPARGMVGWRDSDGNRIYDVVDTSVHVSVTRSAGSTAPQPFTYLGTATDIPWNSPTHPDVSINAITAVKYLVDHGGLSSATPVDGAFEEYTEAFTVSLALLSAGNHTLSIQACNSVGNCSEWLEMLSIPCVFCYYFPDSLTNLMKPAT